MASTTDSTTEIFRAKYEALLSTYDDLLDDLFVVFDHLAFSAFDLSKEGGDAFEKICDVKQVVEGVRGFLPDKLPAEIFVS